MVTSETETVHARVEAREEAGKLIEIVHARLEARG